ncbi:unnamed protein product [Orchesella dallaii]|uniref:BTB domain-containing protein n=1 Tax=Orchesella dallaii TaxID=48710 RepID=A0ABP1PSF8_9HEXA
MAPSKRKAYLLKDGETLFHFIGQNEKIRSETSVLYTANPTNFKAVPDEVYDDDQAVAIFMAIAQAAKSDEDATRIEIHAKYHTFYDQIRILTTAIFPKEFIEALSNIVAEPKISIQGTYKMLFYNTRKEDLEQIDDVAYDFSISDIELKEEHTYENFEGGIPMSDYYIKNGYSNSILNYSVILEWQDFSLDVENTQLSVLEKLFTDKPFVDCCIVASNGVEFKCHRNILSAHSDVLHVMLTSSGFTESETSTIKLEEMSEEGVRNLVSHMYGRELNLEKMKEKVAIELLRAAHMYNILPLETAMLRMLCLKPPNWFTMDNALTLYFFTVHVDRHQNLTEKMQSILKRNSQQLRTATAYKDLMEKQPKEAAELLMNLLELEASGKDNDVICKS